VGTFILCLVAAVSGLDDARLDRDMCGLNSLAVVSAFVQKNPNRSIFDHLLPAEKAPFSLAELERAAGELGLKTYLATWSSKSQARFECPGILHVRARPDSKSPDHFVACMGMTDDKVCIVDFPSAPRLVARDDLLAAWEGDVLYIQGSDGRVIDTLTWESRWRTLVYIGWIGVAALSGALCVSWFRRRPWSQVADSIPSKGILVWSLAGVSVLCVVTLISTMILRQKEPRPPLVADNAVVQVDGRKAQAGKVPVVFRLRNVGRSPVRIERLTSSCICLAARDIVGQEMRPGESSDLEVMVSLPGMGRASQHLSVYHKDSEVPLVLRVEMEGQDSLPVLMHIRNPSPTFEELSGPGSAQVVSIFTREELPSEPWIKTIVCENPDVVVSRTGILELENPKARLVEREYQFSIGWLQMPSTSECYAPLALETDSGEHGRQHIGTVSARRAEARLFSPTLVRLHDGEKEYDIVLFRSILESGDWKLADDVQLPAWLNTVWEDSGNQRRLVLRLRTDTALDTETQFLLPLENAKGFKANLEIVAHPSL